MFTYILFVLIVLNGSNLAAAGVIDTITNQLKEECAVALEWGHIKTPHPIDDLLEDEKYFSVDTEAINLLYLSSNKQYIATIDPTRINCAGSLGKDMLLPNKIVTTYFAPTTDNEPWSFGLRRARFHFDVTTTRCFRPLRQCPIILLR